MEAIIGAVIAGLVVALIVAAFGKKLKIIGAFIISSGVAFSAASYVFYQFSGFTVDWEWSRLASFISFSAGFITLSIVYRLVRDWFGDES